MHAPSRLNLRRKALQLLGLLAIAAALAGCGRCGDWPWTQSQFGACHSDSPRPN
jgi:hypothetical protein